MNQLPDNNDNEVWDGEKQLIPLKHKKCRHLWTIEPSDHSVFCVKCGNGRPIVDYDLENGKVFFMVDGELKEIEI